MICDNIMSILFASLYRIPQIENVFAYIIILSFAYFDWVVVLARSERSLLADASHYYRQAPSSLFFPSSAGAAAVVCSAEPRF